MVEIRDRIVELRRVKASTLLPNPLNWRKHPDKQANALRGVLAQIGYVDALLARETDKGLLLIDGHLRAETTPDQEVPVLILDVDEKEAATILATFDPLSAMAEMDNDLFAELLKQVDIESESLQAMLDEMKPPETAGEIVEDEVPEPPANPITQPGDLWLLGEHRVLCGDSTKAEDVDRVMSGDKANLVFTDPPYGMSFQSNMRTATPKFDVIENDDTILTDWIPNAIRHSEGWVFVWTTWKVLAPWLSAVRPFGALSNLVVWHKGGGGIGDLTHTFATDHELALVFSRGATICGKRIGSVWSFAKDAAATYLHPTQKPVALAAEAIEKTTNKGATVLDLFLGSGTTLIAAEQLDRRCFGMEIDPAYCDVIVQRWEKLTGKTATRETSS